MSSSQTDPYSGYITFNSPLDPMIRVKAPDNWTELTEAQQGAFKQHLFEQFMVARNDANAPPERERMRCVESGRIQSHMGPLLPSGRCFSCRKDIYTCCESYFHCLECYDRYLNWLNAGCWMCAGCEKEGKEEEHFEGRHVFAKNGQRMHSLCAHRKEKEVAQ